MAHAPQLTFPPDVVALVRAQYARAETILEYGSGGSTILAAELGKTCFSVESDRAWAADMRSWLAEHRPDAPVTIHYANIGRTKAWGRPRSFARPFKAPLFWRYPRSVWDLPGFHPPDLILIDGRFRAACFLTCMVKVARQTLVLWDDYTGRPDYAAVAERYAAPREIVGRMALFELAPNRLSARDLWAHRRDLLDPE